MVECDLAKVEVAGSNPVSRSRVWRSPSGALRVFAANCPLRWTFFPHLSNLQVGRGTQVVRERSAKPLYVSSILTRASSLFERSFATLRACDFLNDGCPILARFVRGACPERSRRGGIPQMPALGGVEGAFTRECVDWTIPSTSLRISPAGSRRAHARKPGIIGRLAQERGVQPLRDL